MTDPHTPNHDQPVEGSRSEAYTTPDAGNLGSSTGGPDGGDFGGGSTREPDAGASAKANEVFESLRDVVEDFAEKAAPVVRQFSVKAAEVVATAADKAVPVAHRAGEAAADASGRLAEKSRAWAAETRQSMAGNGTTKSTYTSTDIASDKSEPPTAI